MSRHELQMYGRRIGVGRDYVDKRNVDPLARARQSERKLRDIPLCKNDLTINRTEAENEDLKHCKIR